MTKKLIAKQWHDATIRNNFVFSKTLETNPELCRRLLELILNVKIKKISYPEREKTINLRSDSKGIRLDVYVEEKGTNRSFDIEMQVTSSSPGNITELLANLSSFSFVPFVSNIIVISILSTNIAIKNLTLSSKVASPKFSSASRTPSTMFLPTS